MSDLIMDGSSPPQPPPQALLERLKDYGQEDAFALWNELSPEERLLLVKDIEVISTTWIYSSSLSQLVVAHAVSFSRVNFRKKESYKDFFFPL